MKVFVSSTFEDLKNHRARVINTLRDGSLHVDPMENWSAASAEPREFCLARVAACDLVILLVAFRRGFVPDGETLSITQQEYQYAVEQGIDVLTFLLDEGETNWRPEHDERKTDAEINRWRAQLRKQHGCGVFKADPASLDVAPAVLRWVRERHERGHKAPRLVSPFDFTAFLNQKREGFVGREWLFEKIEQWRTKQQEKSLLIIGDPGIGKSAIAAELIRRNAGAALLAYHCCRADERSTLEPARIVRALAAQVAGRLPEYAACLRDTEVATAIDEANCNSDPVNAYGKGLLGPLSRLTTPDGIHYFLFDALDEGMSGEVRGLNLVQMLAARLNELPPWLRIVATTRREQPVLRRLSGLRPFELNAQQDRNREDVNRYIRERGITGELAHLLESKSDGNFLYLRHALEAITAEDEPLACLQRLPGGLEGIYLHFFERHFPDEQDYEKPRRVLQVIVAAREPLSEKQLAAATTLDDEDELPAVLGGLSSFLTKRPMSGGGEGWTLYHKSLSDWLTDSRTCGPLHYASPKKGRQRLGEWCLAEYRRGAAHMDDYALRHLPGHLLDTERWDDLAAVLTDLSYLEAKADAGLVFAVAADFTTAAGKMKKEHLAHRRLGLLDEALRHDIHFLRRHPGALFQVLWNSGWWYDCPAAAAHYAEERSPGHEANAGLAHLLEEWRAAKERARPGFVWLRSLRPPRTHLGSPQKAVLPGHEGWVYSVSFSSDGQRLASASEDCAVRVWDAISGAEVLTLRGHQGPVRSVRFSAEGRLASASDDGTVRVWDAGSGAELLTLRGHDDGVRSVSFSPTSRRLATASADGTIKVWDAATGTELLTLRGHEAGVLGVAFSPDGRHLASASVDETVRLWEADTGTAIRILAGHAGAVQSVSYSPDGRHLASASADRTVRLWDADSGEELLTLRGHTGSVNRVSFSSDGRIASASHDQTVRVWDAQRGVELVSLRGHESWVLSVSFSSDGRLASASADRTVRVWDTSPRTAALTLRKQQGTVNKVSFSPDGSLLVSGSEDTTVWVWDAVSGVPQRIYRGHEAAVRTVVVSGDGRRIASASEDCTVRVWDAAEERELLVLRGHQGPVYSVSFSPDCTHLASASGDRSACIWDAARGVQQQEFRGHEGAVYSVTYSADGKRIATASEDRTVRLWDAAGGAELLVMRGHEAPVNSVRFSPDGARLVSTSEDGTARVWDCATGACLEVIEGRNDIGAIASGPDHFPWRARAHALGTDIESAATSRSVAWSPALLRRLETHPFCRAWASGSSDHLYLFSLEGDPNAGGETRRDR
jgi:WD40 repeat protein